MAYKKENFTVNRSVTLDEWNAHLEHGLDKFKDMYQEFPKVTTEERLKMSNATPGTFCVDKDDNYIYLMTSDGWLQYCVDYVGIN